MYLIEKISNELGYRITLALKLDKDQEEIIAYGAFCLIQVLWAIFWVIIFGAIFNVLAGAIIITFTIAVLRKYSGGAHFSSPNSCAVIGGVVCAALALITDKVFPLFDVKILIILGMICLAISYFIVIKLAPVDSSAKPIRKVETRQRLKRQSILTLNILLLIMGILLFIYFKYNNVFLLRTSEAICLAIMWQTFTLTSIGHNIFNIIDNFLKFKKGRN